MADKFTPSARSIRKFDGRVRVADTPSLSCPLCFQAAPEHNCQCGSGESDRQNIEPYANVRASQSQGTLKRSL